MDAEETPENADPNWGRTPDELRNKYTRHRPNYKGWTNFLEESKHFMAYGSKSCPKWKFWLGFPRAAIGFYWLKFKDWHAWRAV